MSFHKNLTDVEFMQLLAEVASSAGTLAALDVSTRSSTAIDYISYTNDTEFGGKPQIAMRNYLKTQKKHYAKEYVANHDEVTETLVKPFVKTVENQHLKIMKTKDNIKRAEYAKEAKGFNDDIWVMRLREILSKYKGGVESLDQLEIRQENDKTQREVAEWIQSNAQNQFDSKDALLAALKRKFGDRVKLVRRGDHGVEIKPAKYKQDTRNEEGPEIYEALHQYEPEEQQQEPKTKVVMSEEDRRALYKAMGMDYDNR